jgi:hypothetical protein
MGWYPFDGGRSIGSPGSEEGIIVLDEEDDAGARVTLESRSRTAPFAITCGIYGWMVHTHFLETEIAARAAFQDIKAELGGILDLIPHSDDPELEAKSKTLIDQLSNFVERYR